MAFYGTAYDGFGMLQVKSSAVDVYLFDDIAHCLVTCVSGTLVVIRMFLVELVQEHAFNIVSKTQTDEKIATVKHLCIIYNLC